ncbi:unnamed protein product [Rhodiola kirilowii]
MEEKENKQAEAEKKSEEPKKEGGEKEEEEEKKKPEVGEEANKDAPPPPPTQEVVLKVFMHCEGCAKKVRRSLKGFPGVEDVITDSKTHKVVVKGEKADPVKVVERIQRKSHRKVELISPIPKQEEEPEKPKAAADQEAEKPKTAADQDKKKEEAPQVFTLVLKIHMHCDACSLAIKKRILKIKGVESVDTDLKSSQVTVVGVLDPTKLVDYLYKRTGKHAAIVKQDPPPPNNKEDDEKKKEEVNKGGADQKDDEKKQKTEGGAADDKDEKMKDNGKGEEDEKTKLIEMKQTEFYYYPAFYAPKFAMDQYYSAAATAHPPQMFSDENPNACSVM